MDGAPENLLLLRRELEAERLARVCDRMVSMQAFQPCLLRVGKRVVSGAHVRVLGVGSDRRDYFGREHRIPPGRILKGSIGMPQAVAEAVRPPPVFRLHDLAMLV